MRDETRHNAWDGFMLVTASHKFNQPITNLRSRDVAKLRACVGWIAEGQVCSMLFAWRPGEVEAQSRADKLLDLVIGFGLAVEMRAIVAVKLVDRCAPNDS